jgi:hypothetical protein
VDIGPAYAPKHREVQRIIHSVDGRSCRDSPLWPLVDRLTTVGEVSLDTGPAYLALAGPSEELPTGCGGAMVSGRR